MVFPQSLCVLSGIGTDRPARRQPAALDRLGTPEGVCAAGNGGGAVTWTDVVESAVTKMPYSGELGSQRAVRCTERARPAAVATRRWRHTHGPPWRCTLIRWHCSCCQQNNQFLLHCLCTAGWEHSSYGRIQITAANPALAHLTVTCCS